jgi:hypothetical protein
MVRLETLFRALLDAPDRGISLPWRFSIKAALCIDVCVLVSTMCSVSLVDSPSISLGSSARVARVS